MTEAQAWTGLTTKNHLGAIYQTNPQAASKLMTRIHQTNFGLDLDSYLEQFSPLTLDSDDDWKAPITYPSDGKRYIWNETAYQGDNTKGWDLDE